MCLAHSVLRIQPNLYKTNYVSLILRSSLAFIKHKNCWYLFLQVVSLFHSFYSSLQRELGLHGSEHLKLSLSVSVHYIFFHFSDSLSLFDYSTDVLSSLPRTSSARPALLLVSLVVCILDISRYAQSF